MVSLLAIYDFDVYNHLIVCLKLSIPLIHSNLCQSVKVCNPRELIVFTVPTPKIFYNLMFFLSHDSYVRRNLKCLVNSYQKQTKQNSSFQQSSCVSLLQQKQQRAFRHQRNIYWEYILRDSMPYQRTHVHESLCQAKCVCFEGVIKFFVIFLATE